MQLGTFGAILSFAIDLENKAAGFYDEAAKVVDKDLFLKLHRSANKRAKRLERTRREGVTEMILESITGLDSDDYTVKLNVGTEPSELYKLATTIEENRDRFYTDAAGKIPIQEVVRVLTRMAKENQKQISEIKETIKIPNG
jgi:rubrerythrin